MKELPDYLKLMQQRLGARCMVAFASAVFVGLVTHLYMLTNKITNLDDVNGVPGVGGGAALGRWLQPRLHHLFAEWSAPAINGGMAVLFLSLAVCVIVAALDIRSITGAVLAGAVMLTFPSAASNMYYMLLAPIFALAIFASALGVFLTARYRHGWIAGVILQIGSMACYQAYFGFAASLYVLLLVLSLADGEAVPDAARRGIRYLITLVLSLVGYLLSLRIVGEELTDYKGLNTIGHTSPLTFFHAVLRSYHRVLQYFVTAPESYMKGAAALFNRLLVVVAIALAVAVFAQRKLRAQLLQAAVYALLLVVLFPFALGLIYVMAPELSHASTVMTYCYVVFDFAVIALSERLKAPVSEKRGAAVVFLTAAAGILLFLESYCCYRVTNIAYYRSYIAQTRVMNYYNRIFAKLEEQPDYRYGDRVAVLGGFYPEPVVVGSYDMGAELLADFEGVTLEDHLFLPGNRIPFVRIFLGINADDPDDAEKDAILTSEAFAEMAVYPQEGCVRKVGDIWVVKMEKDDR